MNEPVTKDQLLGILDLLAKRIEDIFSDGMIISESDDGQILALKSKLERKQQDIRAIRALIQRLKQQQSHKREIEKQRK